MKNEELTKQMSNNLNAIMQDRRISNKVLADLIGIDAARVSKLVNGQCAMTSEQVYNLATKLCISTDVIFGITTEKEQMWNRLSIDLGLTTNEHDIDLVHNLIANLKRLINKKRQQHIFYGKH